MLGSLLLVTGRMSVATICHARNICGALLPWGLTSAGPTATQFSCTQKGCSGSSATGCDLPADGFYAACRNRCTWSQIISRPAHTVTDGHPSHTPLIRAILRAASCAGQLLSVLLQSQTDSIMIRHMGALPCRVPIGWHFWLLQLCVRHFSCAHGKLTAALVQIDPSVMLNFRADSGKAQPAGQE